MIFAYKIGILLSYNYQMKGIKMKKLFFIGIVAFFIVLMGSFHNIAFSTPMTSRFNHGDEGWTATGAQITYESSGGNPGGYLNIEDTGGDTFIVTAPSKFYGNLSKFDGGFISYDVISIVPTLPLTSVGSGFGRIAILGGGSNATFDYAPNPPIPSNQSWTEYIAPMNAAAWNTTQENWEKILSNVTLMYIILEPNNWSTVGFDNFEIKHHYQPVPEPSTLFLLTTGLLGVVGLRRKLKKCKHSQGELVKLTPASPDWAVVL